MVRASVIIAALFLAGCAAAPESHDAMMRELVTDVPSAGPAPDRDQGVKMVEDAVRSTLKDPDSAKFAWPNGFSQGWYKPLLGHRFDGWVICGTVNAKNSYGGYVGMAPVIGVINNGAVTKTDMDDANGRYGGMVAEACKKIGQPVG